MEPSNDRAAETGKPADGGLAGLLMVVWIVLAILAIGLGMRGAMMVAQANRVDREVYPRDWPTTGPYSADELQSAGSLAVEQLALVEGRLVVPSTQQVESMAAGQRLIEQGRRENWQRTHAERRTIAASQRRQGWVLFGLGVILVSLFGWAAFVTRPQGRA